jgi:hypothetical protein
MPLRRVHIQSRGFQVSTDTWRSLPMELRQSARVVFEVA